MGRFEAAGVRFYALSYDEPDALTDFASAHEITFPLLSDPNSEIIRDFGILNTTIPPDDHPWFGIPFPGVYVIDESGIITDKLFEHNLSVRTGPDQILDAALGRAVGDSGASSQASTRPLESRTDVDLSIDFDDDPLPVGVVREVVATFALPAGRHLYGPPVPDGMVAAMVEIDDVAGVLALPMRTPPTTPLTLAGTGDTLQVYDTDRVVLRRPVAQNGSAMVKDEDGRRWITVSGRVRWQACDDDVCFTPQSRQFSFRIPAAFAVVSDLGPGQGRAPDMNGEAHFRRMRERRG